MHYNCDACDLIYDVAFNKNCVQCFGGDVTWC